MIQGLLKQEFAITFCSPMWWQQMPAWLKLLPTSIRSKIANEIRKKSFSFVGKIEIITNPVSVVVKEISERLPFGNNREKALLGFEEKHDAFVSNILHRNRPSFVIGYEISSVETFKEAKRQGITTILDLAQVHYEAIDDIAGQFDAMHYILENPQLPFIQARKQAEYDCADYIITLSSFARQTMIDKGIPADKLYEVHLGFDVQLFEPKKKYSTAGPLRLLICGTDMTRKGLGLLLQVVGQMEAQGYELDLTVIGPLAETEAIVKQKSKIKRLKCLAFMPHEDLVKQYQAADVFVFPSYLDSWAMTVLEAMACGTPVIVTENTGSKDAVRKGGGIVIDTGDADALQTVIEYWYKDRIQLEIQGKKAREVAMEYTWENYYGEVGVVIKDICKRSGHIQ
ncbi:MAG: glycosyltransferase family 4 protein [Chitinophagaceae bacterium]